MSFKLNCIGLKTIVVDEIKRFLRIWPQTLLSSAINMLLYFIIFSSFADAPMKAQYGVSYLQFIAPGLIMMSIIINAYGNVSFSLWSQRSQGCIDELITSPLPHSLILIGYTMGGILRGLLVGLLVTGIALFFTQLAWYHIGVIFVIAVCTAALFSLLGFTNALCANKFDDVLLVPAFILTPMTFLGGIFYSISQLSPFWQAISKANPILYIVNAFRYGMINITDSNIPFSLAIVIMAVVAIFTLNMYLMKRGIGFYK